MDIGQNNIKNITNSGSKNFEKTDPPVKKTKHCLSKIEF